VRTSKRRRQREIYRKGYRGADVGESTTSRTRTSRTSWSWRRTSTSRSTRRKAKASGRQSRDRGSDNVTIEVTLQKFDSGLNPGVSERERDGRLNRLLRRFSAELIAVPATGFSADQTGELRKAAQDLRKDN